MKLFSAKKIAEQKPRQHRMLYVLLSFFIPSLLMTLSVVALHIVPFGDKHSLAITDAKWYLNGLISFARLVRGEENLLYSLGNGLGMNQWSSLSWGSFAPANLLALFATLETMPAWFTWICVFNISLCGLTMYIMLTGLLGPKSSHLIFSTSYAMMGFTVVNCYQIGFFQGVQLLPLMILGLTKLLRGQRPWLYILSLACCIFTNFYFGFSLCVASVVFLAAYVYVKRDALRGVMKARLFTYTFSSLIAGLLATPMWLPALKAFSCGGRLDQTKLAEYTFSENMPFIRMFSKLFTGANSQNELVIGMPNIFCGILVLALVILYFMDNGVETRRKRAAAILLGFYLVSFYIPALTLLMHGGTHTNWFPYRYSFVFSFFMIGIAVEEFQRLDALSLQDCRRCGAILLVSALVVFSTSYEFISGACVVLDLALLFLMWVGFWLYKTRPERTPLRVLCLYLLLLVCANQYANFIITTKHVQDWELDLEEYNKNTFVSGVLTEAVKNAEEGFFRMEKDHSESVSVGADPQLYNYNGVSHSGPAERMFVHRQLNRLGINWFDMRHWYSEGIPAATDALLGLKYLISDRNLAEEKGYEYRIEMEGKKLYQSHVFLSPAILANSDCKEIELGANVFDNLNHIWRSMTGQDSNIFTTQEDITFTARHAVADLSVNSNELVDFFEEPEEGAEETEKAKHTHIEYSFVATTDGPVYRYDTSIPNSDHGIAEPAIKYCGFYHAGDTVTGKMTVNNADYVTDDLLRGYCANLAFATADNEVLAEYAGLLNSRDITFEAAREDNPTGSFTAEPGQRILFTIPWDEGWTCYIDGKAVPIDKTWDLFMSVEAPEGHHTYEMKFIPAWLNYGLYLCGASIVGLLVMMFAWKKNKVVLQNSSQFEDNCPPKSQVPAPMDYADNYEYPPTIQKANCYSQNPIVSSAISHDKPSRGDVIRNCINIRALRPSTFYITASIIGAIIVLVVMIVSHGELLDNYFWYDTRDTGMDFINSIEYLHGNHPYSIFGTLYPPLANLFFLLIYRLMPSEITANLRWNIFDDLELRSSAFDLRTFQTPLFSYICFIVISVLAAAIAVYCIVRNRKDLLKLGLVMVSICSFSMFYAFERGNIIVLSWVLIVAFLLTYNSKNRLTTELGLISLAFAAGLKLYPALFGLLLLREKKFKEASRAMLYGLLAVLIPALLLGDGLFGLGDWFSVIRNERLFTFGTKAFDYSANSILNNIADLVFGAIGFRINRTILSVLSIILWISPFLCFFIENEKWVQLFDLTLGMLLLSSQGAYGLILFLIPLLFLIRDRDTFSKENVIVVVCMVLLVIHVPVFYDAASGLYRMTYNHILFIILIVCSLIRFVLLLTKHHPFRKASKEAVA